jgi:hypothetical protein
MATAMGCNVYEYATYVDNLRSCGYSPTCQSMASSFVG